MTPIPPVSPSVTAPAAPAAAVAGEAPALLPGDAFAELLAAGLLADALDPQLPVEDAAPAVDAAMPAVDAALALALAGLPLATPAPGVPAAAPRGQATRELATPESTRRAQPAALLAMEPAPAAERQIARSAAAAPTALPAAVTAPALEVTATEAPLAADAVLLDAPVRTAADGHTLAAAKPVSPVHGMEIRASVHSAGWDAEIGQTVQWMVGARQQVATLNLNPPELGPLEIVVHLAGDAGSQASLTFASPHAEVRAAIEEAMPRLRDMLGNAGIQLGEATVSAESFRERGDEGRGAREGSGAAAALPPAPILRTGHGLIDTFV